MAPTPSYRFPRAVPAIITALVVTVALTSVAGTQGGAQAPATGAQAASVAAARRRRQAALAVPVSRIPRTSAATTVRSRQCSRCRRRSRRSVSSCPRATTWSSSSPIPTSSVPRRWRSTATGGCTSPSSRSYMLDVDAGRQHEPTSRISMHESTKSDGMFDKHTVFADNLLFPRMVLPLDKGILTNETHSDDVLLLTDTNGDGVADRRQVFYTGVGAGRSGNVQQAQSGFVWALDNWIYSTYNAFRFRWTPRGIVREPSGPPGAEWGMSMDDDGKIWLVNAAGERGPANFQIPIQYGAFMVPDQWEEGFEIPWPAPGIADMQGGLPRVRMPAGNLESLHVDDRPGDRAERSVSGGSERRSAVRGSGRPIHPPRRRSSRPKASRRCATRIRVRVHHQHRSAVPSREHQAGARRRHLHPGHVPRHHPGRELDGAVAPTSATRFSSTSSTRSSTTAASGGCGSTACRRHEPVAGRSGPAGGSRRRVRTRPGRDERRDARAARRAPLESDRLVAGYRAASARPEAGQVGGAGAPADDDRRGPSDTLVGRFHAMWTLEGLGALDAALVREQMKDPNPRMRIQAIRASESLFKAGNRTFDADYRAMAKDSDTDVVDSGALDAGRRSRRRISRRSSRRAQAAEQGARREGDRRLPAEPPRRVVAGGAALTSGGAEGHRRGHGDLPVHSASAVTRRRTRRAAGRRRARRDDGAARSPAHRASTVTATTSSRCCSRA